MHPPKNTKACFNCMKRRIVCDLTTPTCKKCEKKGIDCPGYGTRFRFAELKSVSSAELGSVQASLAAAPPSQRSRRGGRDLRWRNGLSRAKRAEIATTAKSSKQDQVAGNHSSCNDSSLERPSGTSCLEASMDHDEDNSAQKLAGVATDLTVLPYKNADSSVYINSCRQRTYSNASLALCSGGGISPSNSKAVLGSHGSREDEPAIARPRVSCYSLHQGNPELLVLNLPPLLSKSDPKTRLLFNHFSTYVSPVMLLYDDESNGYRYQILPLALSDPLIERAVCVAAAFHRSRRWPELRLPAERGQSAIIKKMTEKSLDLSETTWATIIMLIMTDLIAGHEHIIILYNMLVSFIKAREQAKNVGVVAQETALEKFLNSQSKLISFFACPMLGKSEAINEFTKTLRDTLGCLERLAPRQTETLELSAELRQSDESTFLLLDTRTKLYFDIIRESSELYVLRAKDAESSVPDETFQRQLAYVKCLFEQVDPCAPGAHSIVWPAFVAAAESSADQDRAYFSGILQQIWDSTGYLNVLKSLQALPRIWECQTRGQNWTSTLIDLNTLIM
ncbi:hypothetical protein BD289DRAFT_434998 [Coniella lustricola]|uniref:Zn(2)-C6 fungal-type domain-containing protein n=1 Tax=Coniella lustricola TaxID=2025994 RepID=A0A2T3A6Z2_9PEZI|nr:hypothetical protein BD289DRAFT_434998 [Coniella lustricola]